VRAETIIGGVILEWVIGIMIFAGLYSIYDALRKINNNIMDQTEEIIKLQEELKREK
jgi:hypothetical protein